MCITTATEMLCWCVLSCRNSVRASDTQLVDRVEGVTVSGSNAVS